MRTFRQTRTTRSRSCLLYTSTGALVTQKVGALDVPEEGEYFLVIKVTEPSGALGGAGQSGIHLTSFELDGEEPTPLDSVALSLDNTAISKTNPAHASVTGTLANGEAADLRPENLAKITYSSSDTNVVKVDDTGLITAVGSGRCV